MIIYLWWFSVLLQMVLLLHLHLLPYLGIGKVNLKMPNRYKSLSFPYSNYRSNSLKLLDENSHWSDTKIWPLLIPINPYSWDRWRRLRGTAGSAWRVLGCWSRYSARHYTIAVLQLLLYLWYAYFGYTKRTNSMIYTITIEHSLHKVPLSVLSRSTEPYCMSAFSTPTLYLPAYPNMLSPPFFLFYTILPRFRRPLEARFSSCLPANHSVISGVRYRGVRVGNRTTHTQRSKEENTTLRY